MEVFDEKLKVDIGCNGEAESVQNVTLKSEKNPQIIIIVRCCCFSVRRFFCSHSWTEPSEIT